MISICGFEGMCARVAQWWSIALPRRGSRVRIPSRALKEIEKRVIRWMALFSMFKPCQVRTVRMSTLRCPYSRCQFPECGSCPSDRWQHGQQSSRQTHARYMGSIQEFPYTVLQRRETSPLKNACRKQAGYFLCIASAPSLGQNKERIVAIKKLLCNHFT